MAIPQSNPLPPPPQQPSPPAVQANLFEQLGTTPLINKVKSFFIALPVGAAPDSPNPLPDIGELS
jgi:hypothetical protein